MKSLPNSLAGLFPALADIPPSVKIDAPLDQRTILLNGKLEHWDGPVHIVTSPILVDGEALVLGSYPLATINEAESALKSALAAYDHGRGYWPGLSMQERIDHLEGFTGRMIEKREQVVKLILWEIGKTLPDAEKEFDRTVDYIRQTIEAAKRLNNLGVKLATVGGFIGQTKKVPYGVVLCMGPFNYPLNETFTTLIPALLMGNSILFKPPKHGTLLFEPLLKAFAEAFPKGVVNTIYGRGRDVVPYLMQSGKIDVLALIGSSRVADSLKKMHPKVNRLKAVLGLDAKNAAVVLPDADLELAVKESVAGALSFNGQRCTALKLFFVHEAVVERFNTMLVKAVNDLTVGMPWAKGVSITPLAEPGKPDYLQNMIAEAVGKGARTINREDNEDIAYASLMKPVIIYPVASNMALYHQEQFGPVIPVVPYKTLQEPIDAITDSPYGQQVSIFGADPADVSFLIDSLSGQVGRINLNSQSQRSPDSFAFGGRKDSAEGTLSVCEALLAFSTDSVVATKDGEATAALFENILMQNLSGRLNAAMAN